jgi:hypothetical protein
MEWDIKTDQVNDMIRYVMSWCARDLTMSAAS